jgi:hypothetical protein
VFQLVCPDTKCKASIPAYVLKRLLTEEQFERWDRLILQKTLDAMSDVVFCPRCVVGCVEDEDNNAQCPECSFIFCSFCKGPWHPGKQCLTPEQKIHLRKVKHRLMHLCSAVYFQLQTHHTMILLNILFASIRQDEREGGGAGIAEHQRTVQGCSVMPKMPNGHRQNTRVQQDNMRKLRLVLLLRLREGHQWL